MATVIEIEKLALDLPEKDRATLIANLLDSLPPILSDDDEGIAERCGVTRNSTLIPVRRSLRRSLMLTSALAASDAFGISSARPP